MKYRLRELKMVGREAKRLRVLSFSVLIFFFSSCSLWALAPDKAVDRYLFDEWRIADGLPSDTINSIAQTADGYLWIGTTKALVRFDGVRFETFSVKGDQKKDNWITHLFVDKGGVLWVGSQNGLRQYKGGQFRRFSKREGLSGNYITFLNEDIKGNLWIGTNSNYLNRLIDGIFTLFNEVQGLKGSRVSSIFEDDKGILWVGASQDGLFKFLGGRFFKVEIKGLGSSYAINAVYEDRKGGNWRGTNKGLLETRGKDTLLYTTVIGGLSNNDVKAILEDSDGNLWVGTANGINRLQVEQPGEVKIESYFTNTLITCLFEDREKSIWIGTNGSGLKRMRDGVFTTYTVEDGLPNSYIYSLCEDQKGEIWIGSGYGLCRFKAGEFIPFLTKLDNPKKALHADRQGNLWVGTDGSGLFRIHEDEVFNYPLPDQSLVSSHILALYIDSQDNLWVGTDSGLNRRRAGNLAAYTTRDGLWSNTINSIYEDKDHHIWIGTSRGIHVVKKGELSRQHIEGYLPGAAVSCIYEDRGNVFWIGTYGEGLKRIKQGSIFSYTVENGLGSNNIYKILEDDRGNFWISSDNGVLKVNKTSLNDFANGHIDKIGCVSFGLSDGMRSMECSRSAVNSAVKTQRGRLWFATKMGISVVDPDRIRINKLPPPVTIERIVFDDHEVPRESWFNNPRLEKKAVKDVTFYFTAATFISPEKVRFKYMLEGGDSNWIYSKSGQERAAHYPDLSPGSYTFRVTACNSDGVWNRSGDTVTFTIKPVFSRTILFKILIFFSFTLFGLAVYFLYKKDFFRREEKYKSSTLDPEKAEEYLKKLFYLLEVEKVYRDENISLHLLSEKLSISIHHLSQIINEKMNKNFIGLINGYRVEEAKKRLLEPPPPHLSILGIAFEVGFNSKAAFNRAFKKFTGLTPSEYRKKHTPH